MNLTPIVSVLKKDIEIDGGYYKYDLLFEVVDNIVNSMTRHCMVNVQIVDTLLSMYAIDTIYKNVIIDSITTHLRKVSAYILEDPENRLVHIHSGFLPDEVVFVVSSHRLK